MPGGRKEGKPMISAKDWSLNPWEEKCLAQMDDEAIWERLKRPMPSPDEPLPRSVFRMIAWFNFAIFGVVMLIFGGIGVAFLGLPLWQVLQLQYLLLGLVFVGLAAGSMALYAASIYVRAWNKRMRRREAENAL
jgi:hypothetical protein